MNFPKILENTILNSENVQTVIKKIKEEQQTQFNNQVVEEVQKAIKAAKKDWSLETVKALDNRFGKARKFVSTSGGFQTSEKLMSSTYSSGKNYDTLTTLFSDSPGSIQSASRIRDAVIGGGYVIKGQPGKKGSKKDLNKLIDFFDSPNPDDTIETLLGVSLENYLAYGNFYWEKVPTKGSANKKQKELAQLYNLDPVRMSILVDADKKKKGVLEKIGYKQKTDSYKGIIYGLDEVFHSRRPNRRADLYGRAVLEDNMATLQLLMRALTYNINVLKNGGRPPIQLVLPVDSIEADADAVSAYFEKNYMGAHNAGKTLVSYKGAKAEVLGVTPQEMAYLELLNYGLRLVAGQYGVPLHLVGFPEDSNRASSSESRRSFYLTTIFNLRKVISQKITREIIQKGLGVEGWRIDFKTAGLEESEASRRDFILARDKGLYTENEARIAMGLLPLDEKWADELYLVSTKNDAMIEIEKSIGRISDPSAPDQADSEDSRGKGEPDPSQDDAIHDE
jgi:HK97 family phage portal protein